MSIDRVHTGTWSESHPVMDRCSTASGWRAISWAGECTQIDQAVSTSNTVWPCCGGNCSAPTRAAGRVAQSELVHGQNIVDEMPGVAHG